MEVLRLMADIALVVLIWLVQLIIYPSFRYLEDHSFKQWHTRYMKYMSLIVFPLMLFQLLLYTAELVVLQNWIFLPSLCVVLLIWLHTFFIARPIHHSFGWVSDRDTDLVKLLKVNWLRVLGWNFIWFWALYQYYF